MKNKIFEIGDRVYDYENSQKILVFSSKEIRGKFLEDYRDLIEIAKPLL